MSRSSHEMAERRPSGSPPGYPSPPSLCVNCRLPYSSREEDLDQPLPGWPKLASFVTNHPGLEAFPSFRDLNIKSLLYYQAELQWLRKRLHEREWFDSDHHQEHSPCRYENIPQHVAHLLCCEGKDDPVAGEQFRLIMRIREVLEKYNNALMQYSQITALPKSDPSNVETLQKWLVKERVSSEEAGSAQGHGSDSWDIDPQPKELKQVPSTGRLFSQFLHLFLPRLFQRNAVRTERYEKLDLIVPRSTQAEDGLTRWVKYKWAPFLVNFREWRKRRLFDPRNLKKAELDVAQQNENVRRNPIDLTCFCKKEDKDKLNIFRYHRILIFTSSVATVIACAIPIAAISVLSKLHSQGEVLGIIAVFTVAFAGGLMFLSGGARRVDIFTATAAFSAVMVVFVQNQNGGSCSQCPSTP